MTRLFLLLLLSLPFAAPGQAEEFGRLFTTPGQRVALDRIRDKAGGATHAAGLSDTAPPPATAAAGRNADDTIELTGLVYSDKRQQGTAWVNGVNTDAPAAGRPPIAKARVAKTHVTITLPGGSREYRLKVGQKLEPESGRVSDLPLQQTGDLDEL